MHRLLAVLDGRRQLGEEERGHGGVLVAGVGALQVAVRFLEAEEEPGESRLVDPLGDPLEADEQVVLGADPLALGERPGHLGGDQRGDQVMVGPEPAQGLGLLDDEGRQEHGDLVAVERGPLARWGRR